MSDAPITVREWQALRDDIKDGFSGINGRLDRLNGQTRKHGEEIAVLKSQIADTPSAVSKKAIAGYGTAIGSGVVIVVEIAKAAWAALKS